MVLRLQGLAKGVQQRDHLDAHVHERLGEKPGVAKQFADSRWIQFVLAHPITVTDLPSDFAVETPPRFKHPAGMKSASLWLLLASLAFVGLTPQHASAQVGLTVSHFEDDTLRVDGMLREWADARFVDVGTGNDGAMRCALGYDGRGLYVAAEVRDERLIRNAQPGNGDDAVIVTLALPSGRALEGIELWLHPGESGRSAAALTSGAIGASRRTAVRGATVVEAPRTGGGYIIEAFIPFAALRNGTRWQEGRASLRLHDVDSLSHPEAENEPVFAPVDRAHLDLLPTLRAAGGEGALLEDFLRTHELAGTAPRFDLRGNVTGDAEAERVVIAGRFVVATGRAIQQGRGFVFVQLPIETAADVREARLEDWTGDGVSELIVTMQQAGGGGSRQLTQVIVIEAQAVRPGWAAEVQKQTPQGSVTSTLRVARGRRGAPPTITIRAGAAQGLDAATLREAPPSDVEAMLLPWGPVLERSYRWDGRAFARVGERPNPRYVDPETVTPPRTTTPVAATPTAPTPPTLDAVIAGFRQERGLAANARPSRDLTANVVGTAAPERVLLFGADLVIVGAEFRNGTGWFHYALPAASAADVLDVRLADVTGDARAEILVRIRQTIGDVRREVLLVHQLTVTGFPVILQRELAREQGTNRVENEIRTEGGRLEIGIGTARGYSATAWPFAAGPSSDGVETVLLPWRDRGVTYRFAGGRLVP